jgi:PAS domain S-box-containing protein
MHKRLLSIIVLTPFTIGLLVHSGFLQWIFVTDRIPRHVLFVDHPWMMFVEITSDVLIALAYALFFASICWLVQEMKRISELQAYLWVFTALRIFLLASGGTHLLHVVTVWWPVYRFSIAIRGVCALAAVPTAALFSWQTPAMAKSIQRFFALLKTEHEHAKELRERQELLDRTGRIAGVGGWTLNLETQEISWTAETFNIHGVPPGYKPTFDDALNFFPPEHRTVIIEAVERARTTGAPWDMELPLVRADGRHIWVRTVGEIDQSDGKHPRLIGALQDKTAQIAIRQELRQANERVTLATDSGGIGIFDWDIEQDLCTADPWMHRLYGEEARLEATPLSYWAKNIHPDDRPRVIEALDDAIANRRPYDTEFRVVWKDGSVHYLRATGKVTRDKTGRAMHMVGANWDVSESRRLTAQFAEQHELMRVTLQSIGDGVITTDPQRNVTWLNPAAERMTGWSNMEAVGRPLTQIFQTIHEDTRVAAENPVASPKPEGNAVRLAEPTLLVSRNGSEFGIENLAAPIRDSRGDLLGSVLVFRDVTEQRRLAAETKHVTKLQLELKLKDEFLSHVSHELRSPLTSIYSFSSIISDDLAGETTPQQKEYLQIILKNVTQLQAMIEDLLTVTQTREGKLSIDTQKVSVSEAVADALNTIQGSATLKQIALSANDSTHLPPACADPTRLRQILIILLDNAVKFTPQGGAVDVRVSTKDPDFLLFQVTDTGCGIPPDKRTRVFESLYQVRGPSQPDTSQAGRTGLGLGLHIARNLVTRQGGYIWVTDGPVQGSTFNFTLPVFASADGTPRRRKTDRTAGSASNLAPAA